MAYVLGYLYADGSMEDASYLRGKYVRVSSTDKETILMIKKILDSEHTIVESSPSRGKKQYLLRIGNTPLYDSLIEIGLYPNKSLTIKIPSVPDEFFSDFVRGYFDGDGCVSLYRTKGILGQEIINKLTIIFTSGSFDFLHELCNTLHTRLNLRQQKVYRGDRSFQLRYATEDSVKLFEFLFAKCGQDQYYLQRKFEIFKYYFQKKPKRVTEEIEKIFQKT
ncbi:MAG: hypothetical protein A2494_03685 [Candidatus Lloydbacteria bacterium RIFOXYC12_FULL_46_25]|uniref:DOD-type homing endonuclease domain-containing protein n=1 Tax=Candidatus Lloydbacteria bacterium RIFOXYC12_FULL_46_25 TaxID=1798670 RepID=A0A1G2DUD4_9BACT|nr:MAG: hypothetical protein A2494_03685 [Candidatus Lloydbacteria bacterium RIFOXYC12_FULL_46_25]